MSAVTSADAIHDPAVASARDQQQYLTFLLGDEMFAVGILCIREIIGYGQITEVPMTPPFIRGVINLRGAVVPVLDLARRLGREPRDLTRRTCIVIVDVDSPRGTQEMGIVVDTVSEVLEILPQDIEPAPEFGGYMRIDFICGMAKINGAFIVLLALANIVSMDEVAVVAALGSASAI